MDALKVSIRPLAVLLLAGALFSCSKFGRLSGSDRVAQVRVSAPSHGAHARTYAPQTGGVMIWAEKADGTQAAAFLDSDTASYTMNLTFGDWSFYATGWDGAAALSGSPRCGAATVSVNSGTTDVAISIDSTGCGANDFFGTSAVRPLRIVSCNYAGNALTGDSLCSGTPNVGNLKSFRVLLNTFDPTSADSATLKAPAVGPCVFFSTGSYVETGLYIPEGAGGSTPIDATIEGFTDTACSAGEADYHFNNGFAAGASAAQFRNDGISGNANRNIVFLGHEPAPTATSAAPASNLISLNGGFPLTVSGSGFDPAATVTVGGVNCPVTSPGFFSITCTAPPAYNSLSVVVKVTNGDGQTATTTFSYVEDGFGNGIDADRVDSSITISTSIPDTSDAANSAMTSLFGGRALQAFANIKAISGTTVYLRNAFTTADFALNDDVLWHVSAKSAGTTDCDSGGTLAQNVFGYARVTAVDLAGRSVTLDQTIVAGANASNLLATSRTAGSSFCLIQLVRVPNFQNLTLDSTSSAITISPPALSLSAGYGGILALKVSDTLTLTGTNPFQLSADNKGYGGGANGGGAGTAMQGGAGLGLGVSNSTGNLTGGGGATSTSGGGGGGGVIGGGGQGGNYPSSAGASGTLATSNPVGLMAAFGSGGGGGYDAGANGAAGGGIAMLMARNISGAQTLYINARSTVSGGTGSTSGGGGGSGGTAYVQVMAGLGGASIAGSVAGGAGGAGGTAGGGGGAGGLFSSNYCTGTNPGISPVYPFGAGGAATYTGADGSAGTGSSNPNSPSSAFCP